MLGWKFTSKFRPSSTELGWSLERWGQEDGDFFESLHPLYFLFIYVLHHICSLLTFFMRLCLLCGLAAVVSPIAFILDWFCIFHVHFDFLSRWSKSWLVFDKKPLSTAKLPHKTLCSIVFTNRICGFRHIEMEGIVLPVHQYHHYNELRLEPPAALERLASGDWSAFLAASDHPYNVCHPRCQQIMGFPTNGRLQNLEI